MSLDPVLEHEYTGEHVFVESYYGWGWSHRDRPGSIEAAPHFHARIRRFLWHGGWMRGLLAVIAEPGHPYDGKFVILVARTNPRHDPEQQRLVNFTDRTMTYSLWVLDDEPPENPFDEELSQASWMAMYDVRLAQPAATGYGMVRQSRRPADEMEGNIACPSSKIVYGA